MFEGLSDDEIRSICKNSIENFESWSRRIINNILSKELGSDYFNTTTENNKFLFKKELLIKVNEKLKKDPKKYKRQVDTLLVEDIIYILTKPILYKTYFKEVLDLTYPVGNDNIKIILNKLIEPRNNLCHANPISIRQAEQVICYTNDFVECYKLYFKKKGEEKMWNVPQIIKYADSSGVEKNTFNYDNRSETIDNNYNFYVGEKFMIEVTIDPSFNNDEYTIKWEFPGEKINASDNKIELEFKDKHVSQNTYLFCSIISKETWHRHGSYDHKIAVKLTIFPKLNN